MIASIPPGSLLLTGRAVELCRYAAAAAQRYRTSNGLPPLVGLTQLAEALAAAGQADMPAEPEGQPDTVTTHEAAALLGCSERQVRRKAALLGGRLTGGRWLLDRAAIAEHLEGGLQ